MPKIHQNNPCGTDSKADIQPYMPPEEKQFSLAPQSVKKQCLINNSPDTDTADWYDMGLMFVDFFEAWMQGYNLQVCIACASSEGSWWHPFRALGGYRVWLPQQDWWTWPQNFHLVYNGYPWITRDGYD